MKNQLLSDHKKIGKVFLPPILSVGTFVETAWLDLGVPEFVWIEILCEEYGIDEGSLLFLEFSKISDKYFLSKTNNGAASALVSYYGILSEKDKSEIIKDLKKKAFLPKLRSALTPFLSLYPFCPLNFILEGRITNNIYPNYLPRYKEYLEKLTDKRSFESTIVIANVVNFLNHLGRIKISISNSLPEFREIVDYPQTENSKHIASFLRATIPMCFNTECDYNRDNEWIKYFWNQSSRLEPFTI